MNEVLVRLTSEAVSPKLELGRKSMPADTGTLETNASLEKVRVHAAEAARVAKEALAKDKARQQEEEQRRFIAQQNKKKEEKDKEVVVAPNQAELITAWEKYIKQNTVKGSEARKQAEELAQRLIKQGKMPDELTSKGAADATAGQVVENAVLDEKSLLRAEEFKKLLNKDKLTEKEEEEIFESHKERLSKAQQLLERTLTKKQKLAFLKAHYIGLGEKGKDGSPAGAYNLTQKQIAERARLLEEAGFSKNERRELIESGLAAATDPAGNPIIDYNAEKNAAIATFLTQPAPTNATLLEIRNRIEQLQTAALAGGGGGIKYEELVGYLQQFNYLTKEQTSSLPANEYSSFKRALREIEAAAVRADDISTRHETIFESVGRDTLTKLKENKPGVAGANPAIYDQAKEQFRAELKRFVTVFNPSGGYVTDEAIRLMIDFAAETADPTAAGIDKYGDPEVYESLERLALKIIAAPLGAETGDYQLGFHAGINFDAILTNLKSKVDESTGDVKARLDEQLRVLTDLEESLKLFHEMNRFSLRGEFEDAAKFATSILPKYSEVLQKRKGVGTIQRLLETAHSVTLSRDGIINEDNDQAMMGAKVNKITGRFDLDQSGSVLDSLIRQKDFYNDPANAAILAAAPEGMRELAAMDDWEIGLAFATARNIFNIQQRKGEWVAQSQIPEGHQAYESIPQEAAAKLYNAPRWLWDRFGMGKGRGGQIWLKRLEDAMQSHKEVEAWGHTDIEKIRDDDIRKFELPTLTGIRAWWATWRATGGILRQTPADFDLRGEVSGAQIYYNDVGTNEREITHANADLGSLLNTDALIFKKGAQEKKWEDLSPHARADYFRSVFLEPNGELRNDFQSALGVVYKVWLNPQGGHHAHKYHELNEVKEEIRTKIWERVAKENPLIAISYLHGLRFKGQKQSMFVDVYKDRLDPDPDRNFIWKDFEGKMNFYHEIKMAKIKGKRDPITGGWIENPEPSFTLQDAINWVNATVPGGTYALNAAEHQLLTDVENAMNQMVNGKKIAQHMANVKYAFVPFMNDTMLEQFDYNQPGREAYARHYRDLGNFAKSNNAISEKIDNLGKIHDYEGMMEFLDAFTAGIAAVHGDEYAKDKAYVVADATLGFFRRGEQADSPILRTLNQLDIVHGVKEFLHKPNSEAQKAFNSVHLLALDRQQVYNAMHEWLAAGTLGHQEEEELKKRFGGGVWRFFLKMLFEQALRGAGLAAIGGAVGFSRSFGKEAANTDILKEE